MKENYTFLSDGELVSLYRGGDRAAVDSLLGKYKDLVRSRARVMYLAGGDTDDLIQEGMIGLFKAIRDYEPDRGTSFRTFALMCIERQMFSAVQYSNRKKHSPLNSSVALDQDAETEMWNSGRSGENPEELMINQENAELFAEKITESLTKLEKEVLNLYLDGNSYKEIGEALGRSGKSVDNALRRVRTKIREKSG